MRNINEQLLRMKKLMSHGVNEQYSEEDRLGKGVSGLAHPPDAEWENDQGERYTIHSPESNRLHGPGGKATFHPHDYEIWGHNGQKFERVDEPHMIHHKTQRDAISVIVDKLGGKMTKITNTSKPIAPGGDDVNIDSGDLEYGMIPDNLNEGAFEYDPTQVVHKDKDVIVIDQNIDSGDASEYEYDEEDVTFEDGDWLVINPDEEQGGCGDKASDGDPVNTNDYDFYGAGPSDMDSDGIPDDVDDKLGEQKTDTVNTNEMRGPNLPYGPSYMDSDGIPDDEDDQLEEQLYDVNGHLIVQSTGSKDDKQKKIYKVSEAQLNMVKAKMTEEMKLGEGPKRKWRKRAREIRKKKA